MWRCEQADTLFSTYPFTLCTSCKEVVGRDSLAGIATRYGLDDPGIESRWEQIFPQLYRRTSGAHTASYTTRIVSLSRGVKRPGCSVKHPLPSSDEVKERVELYLYYTSGPSWPVLGRTCYAKKVQKTYIYIYIYSSTHF